MKTSILKLKPLPVIKPWGLLHCRLKEITGIPAGIGELWLASAQSGDGNAASEIEGGREQSNLAELLENAGNDGSLEKWLGGAAMNSIANISCRGKTEAWLVRESRGFVGFAAGPPGELEKEKLKQLFAGPGLGPDVRQWSEEVRSLFGIITPLQNGESFLVPAGALHTMFALGEGSYLVVDEIQQGYGAGLLPTLSKTLLVQDSLLSVQVHPDDETVRKASAGELVVKQDLQSKPTVRVYDFGRRPGEDPELGFNLTDPASGLRRVNQLDLSLEGGRMTVIVACPQFIMSRLLIEAGGELDSLPVFGSYRVLHCTDGGVQVRAPGFGCDLTAGETAFVPAELESGLSLIACGESGVIDQAVPDLAALHRWCKEREIAAGDVEKLLHPPRAL